MSRLTHKSINRFRSGLVGKRIRDYSTEELLAIVEISRLRIPGFFAILNGIDAYFTLRERRQNYERHAED